MGKTCAAVLVCCLIYAYSAVFPVAAAAGGLPDNFVYVEDVIPGVKVDLRYCAERNFLGRRVDGYLEPKCILTRPAAEALRKVQEDLSRFGLAIKIFDAYRPQRAVDDFVRWGRDLTDTKMKEQYYPKVRKEDLFKEGYIAEKSSHSRGSTVDLTIVCPDKPPSESELDMGTPFDFFGSESWVESPSVSAVHRAHRMLLQMLMQKHGFEPYTREWWHFTLKNETFPNTYFDFSVR
ncbi:MAG: M15 family metallopeptidase [Pseudomonadota bacterium]